MRNLYLPLSFGLLFGCWLSAMPAKSPAVKDSPSLPSSSVSLKELTSIAGGSSCAKYSWTGRGKAPAGYIKGMALTYAKAVCHLADSANTIVAKSRSLPESSSDRFDALSWYNSNFMRAGMPNDVSGGGTLRHAYALLIGLGMRESSGAYCCGRDMSASFSSSDTAEAGAFQSSWGARLRSIELSKLFQKYSASSSGCFLEVFKEGASCRAGDAKNWGTGDGEKFQALSKSCPAFAAEYAAVLIRLSGGTRGEYGPLRTKAAEIKSECDEMLQGIEKAVNANKNICLEF